MSGQPARLILDIEPNYAGLDKLEARAVQSFKRIEEAKNKAFNISGNGGKPGPGPNPSPTNNGASAWQNFIGGFNKAGGFPSAIATVIKYAAAYKMVEAAAATALFPLRATVSFIQQSTKDWIAYEQAMADAARTMRQGGWSTNALKGVMGRDALRFMEDYRVKLDEVAQAQYELGSANFDAATTMQTYQIPLKVNLALMGDITQTTRIMTQMLKIHGDQMGDNISDQEKMTRIGAVLLKTWEIEQVELSDLSNAYKYVAGNAKILKLPLQELIPLLGTLSTFGMRGSIGGTGVNQMLTQLSRTVSVTEDGLMKIRKMTREAGHEINLGIKPGEAQSLLQMINLIGKAIAPLGKDFAGKLAQSGILNDIFNVRGARPAALLSDLDTLEKYLQAVADAYTMTGKKARDFIEDMVNVRQNTPEGALQLLENQIYSTGVQFMQAASGADTFVGAINALSDTIKRLSPMVIDIGYKVHGLVDFGVAFAESRHKGESVVMATRRGNAAQIGADIENIQQRVTRSAQDRALQSQSPAEYEKWRKGQEAKARAALGRANARVSGTTPIIPVGPGGVPLSMPVEADAAAETRRLTALWQKRVSDKAVGILYEDKWAGSTLFGTKGERDRVAAQLSYEAWRDAAYDKIVAGPKKELEATAKVKEIDDMLANLGKAGTSSYHPISGGNGGKSKGKTPKVITAADMFRHAQQLTRQEDSAFTSSMYARTAAIREADAALSSLDIKERLFGETETTIAERLRLTENSITAVTAARDKQAAEAAKQTSRANLLGGISRTLQSGGKLSSGQNAYLEGIWTPEMITNLKKDGRLSQFVNDMFYEAQGKAEAFANAAEQFKQKLQDMGASVVELQRKVGMEGLANALDDLNSRMADSQALLTGRGIDWENSALRANYLKEQIRLLQTEVGMLNSKLVEGKIGLEEYKKLLDERKKGITTATGALYEIDRANRERREDLAQKIRETQIGWMGSGTREETRAKTRAQIAAANDALAVEVKRLKLAHPQDAPFLDAYERNMRVDNIVRPWLDARSRIQSEWTGMFSRLYSDLVSGGDSPWKAFIGSIIGTAQDTIFQAIIAKALAPLFDAMATAETGITPQAANMAQALAADEAGRGLLAFNLALKQATDTLTQLLLTSKMGGETAGPGYLAPLMMGMAGLGAAAKKGGAGGGTPGWIGGLGFPSAKWGDIKGIEASIMHGIQTYSAGSMVGGLTGSLFGRDPASSAVYGGIGATIGSFFGPVGAIVGGLLGGLFGKKKPKQTQDNFARELYGMPEFEYQSYLYNMTDVISKGTPPPQRINGPFGMTVTAPVPQSGNTVNIVIQGGNLAEVEQKVNEALQKNFGPAAVVQSVKRGSLVA